MDMKVYLILFGAIAAEVCGTMLLPLTQGFSKALPSGVVIVSYCLSFYLLSISVGKLPLSIVYASWAGLGVFSVALLSHFFFDQDLNWPTVAGLFLIVVGVILVNVYKSDMPA
jgi:small multidrug resistance pump